MKPIYVMTAVGAAVLLAACGGGGGSSNETGTLTQQAVNVKASLTAAQLDASLSASTTGAQLKQIAGAPKCGVEVQYYKYNTVGGQGEAADATAALMLPTGGADCTGPRPVVLYAHGTTFAKGYNLASLADPTNAANGEAVLLAAMFAAQGFIVVAPNYAGYDTSSLSYHPYLNADQQSKDMINALRAARSALNANLPTSTQTAVAKDSGKLFITGYSQGGHVAMATHKAMQASGAADLAVTASAPMSGPYAMGAFMDAIFYGNVNLGASLFSPMLMTSYQKAYGNLYAKLSDVYEEPYASGGIDTVLPSATALEKLIADGKVPQTRVFSATAPAPAFEAITPPKNDPAMAPLFALGFGNGNLINNATRLAVLTDAAANPDGAVPTLGNGLPAANAKNPIRVAAVKNDLRNWTPKRPVLLCGGNADPTVFYEVNTTRMHRYWSAPSTAEVGAGLLQVLDVDATITGATDPFAPVKAGFANAKAATATAAVAKGDTDGGASAVVQAYHGGLVPPFCTVAARGFFQQVLASGT